METTTELRHGCIVGGSDTEGWLTLYDATAARELAADILAAADELDEDPS